MPTTTSLPWGTIDGKAVHLFTLTNARGLVLKVTNFGAIITELHAPDRSGRLADVTLGFDSLEGYIAHRGPYFGAVVGRYANRIARGELPVGDHVYQLARNDGNVNHLHGGLKGFDRYVWDAQPEQTAAGPAIRLRRTSPDGEENYPGELAVTVTYTLTDGNELVTEMSATTTAPTFVNLAQHAYWNLAGHDAGDVLGHVVTLHADRHTVPDAQRIPTGELAPVENTALDFRAPKPVGRDLHALAGGNGYDHNFVVDGEPFTLRPVATVLEPTRGRVMELSADQPGVQLYTGGFLGGEAGKRGCVYQRYAGLCLETQCFPDSPHHADWPSAALAPGQTYRHTMVTRFATVG